MANINISRILGRFSLRDPDDSTKVSAVVAAGENIASTKNGILAWVPGIGEALTSLTALLARIGEVQASPTANTVLDRLKSIATYLSGPLVVSNQSLTTTTATIALGNNVTGTIDCSTPTTRMRRIVLPSAMNGVEQISAMECFTSNGVFAPVCYPDGSEWVISVAPSSSIAMSPDVFDTCNYLVLRSGTAALPANTSGSSVTMTIIKG